MSTKVGAVPRHADAPRQHAPAAGARPSGGDLWAVVLAGGQGRRLERFVREILRSEGPKQFCRIVGTRSMLRHTWDRALRLVEPDRVVTIVTAGQERYVDEEARLGVPGTVLVQPQNRETAPGLLFPLLWIAGRAPGAIVAVFPADHFVWEEDRFEGYMRAAVIAAERLPDHLTLLGVEPDGPETGYGWIAPGDAIDGGTLAEVYQVRKFCEKPDKRRAAHFFARGYFWNTLVLAGRLETYLALGASCVPHVFDPLQAIADSLGTPREASALGEAYRRIASTNFSRSILVRSPEDLMMVGARGVAWSDWGDPDRIVHTLRRFDRRPHWLPAYARARAQAAAGA